MSRLTQLQRNLQSHVLHGATEIAKAIDESTEISAATRLRIYFDAYRLRLIEALQANYPLLARLLGEDEFSALAQLYLALYPSQHYSVRWFGAGLDEFLAKSPQYRDRPLLTELARWEWAIAAAFDAGDAAPLGVADLAAVAPADWPMLSFVFHTSVQRIELTTNVVAIVKAADGDAAAELPAPAQLERSSDWLIWRQELTVQYRSLDAAESAAIEAARRGDTFAAICETIAQHGNADSAPLAAASQLKQWIIDGCVIGLNCG